MPKLTVTRRFLFQVDQDIKIWEATQPALWLLLSQDIKKFYREAKVSLQIMEARFTQIKQKYVEQDDQGNFIIEEHEGKPKWKLLKVKVDITQARTMNAEEIEKAFADEGNKMFDQQVTIEW